MDKPTLEQHLANVLQIWFEGPEECLEAARAVLGAIEPYGRVVLNEDRITITEDEMLRLLGMFRTKG